MRKEKISVVSEVQEWVQKSPFVVVVDYTGTTVGQFSELRSRLDGVKSEIHVVKNTFLRRALSDAKLPEVDSYLSGQTAVVFGQSDIAATAKILKNFSSEFQKPKVRVGLVGEVILDADQVAKIADLPSREVLLSQLLGLLNTPAQRLARIINTPASQLAQVIKAHVEKGE
ncbi:MAG: 50S ribosomal protein L10 [Blastochloris sp.]|jgi:large subunit ribosomal protein L10|nr:50S ribosomal protein L10 [Blastochloris sp.]